MAHTSLSRQNYREIMAHNSLLDYLTNSSQASLINSSCDCSMVYYGGQCIQCPVVHTALASYTVLKVSVFCQFFWLSVGY